MAKLVGVIHRYIGTSTEEKPYVGQVMLGDGYILTAADLPAGSTFDEKDTGDRYEFDGRGWNLIGSAAAVLSRIANTLDEVLAELKVQTGHLAAGSEMERSEAEELGV